MLGEVFLSVAQEVDSLTREQERRSAELKKHESQMMMLNSPELTERRDLLLQEIDGHAARCIEMIVEKRDAIKAQVWNRYKLITEVTENLNKIPELPKLDSAVEKARQLLTMAEPHPVDIAELFAVKHDIVRCGIQHEIDIGGYWTDFRQLLDNPVQFVPLPLQEYNMGTFEVKKIPQPGVQRYLLTFEKELVADDEGKFIPCVANLGKDLYAVAHPTVRGQPADAIDVYKVPGEFLQTIRDHAAPLYDMDATPDGQIAVLSDGETEGTCSVRIFDPETGYLRSTKDFHIRDPLTLDVNKRYQFVILNKDTELRERNECVKRLSVFNEDGSVEITQIVDETSTANEVHKISCSARYFYITGKAHVFAVYEQEGKQLVRISDASPHEYDDSGDISARYFDEISSCLTGEHCSYYGRHALVNNELKNWTAKLVGKHPHGADIESRLSVKDNYIVSSQGRIIRVYQRE
jgi:hypothetical protein